MFQSTMRWGYWKLSIRVRQGGVYVDDADGEADVAVAVAASVVGEDAAADMVVASAVVFCATVPRMKHVEKRTAAMNLDMLGYISW